MGIDLAPFRRALESLEKGLARADSAIGDDQLRDGAIQRFEYTYELAWKSLRRVLKAESATPDDVDALSFRDVLRVCAEKGIVDDPVAWFAFRESRNASSHAYDGNKAAEVFAAAHGFARAARVLLDRLEARV